MAVLLTSVFGATGCGSDDDVQAESRVKNVAPEASAVSDALSEADCDRLLDLLDLLDDLDRLEVNRKSGSYEILDTLIDRLEVLRREGSYEFLDLRELYYSCAEALRSGNYAPEGDDVDGG